MTAVAKLLEKGLLTLGVIAPSGPLPSRPMSVDPLFASYKQALKMIVRAEGILKKLEAIISFCNKHYDGMLILSARNGRFVHCKTIRIDKSSGIIQDSIKKDLGDLSQEPVFQAVQRSGIGFFGKIFSSRLIRTFMALDENGECALLPIVNRPDLAMFFYAYTRTQYTGISPHHYLELLSWMIFQMDDRSVEQTPDETAEASGDRSRRSKNRT